MRYSVRSSRSRSNCTRRGSALSAAYRISPAEERSPAPYTRRPSGVRMRPNSIVYQYKPREVLQRVEPRRLEPALAVVGHVVGVHRVEEQRHVAEEVVEHVGLDDVVELLRAAQPVGDREAAVREVREEGEVGDEAGHRDELPAGRAAELPRDPVEARDAVTHVEPVERVQELLARIPRHELHLAVVELAPQRVLCRRVSGPVLLDRVVGPGSGVVAAQIGPGC